MRKRTRWFQLAAAALFLVTIFLPFWFLTMSAPAYPEGDLKVVIYSTKLTGDLEEWHRMSRLVGVKVPPDTPELDLMIIPAVMVGLAVLSVAAAFRGRVMAIVASGTAWLTLTVSLALFQYRLYTVGHDLDTTAPLRNFVKGGFTPPAIGSITVGSITTYHWPHIGAVAVFVATMLLTGAALYPQLARLWEWAARRLARPAPDGSAGG